MTKSSIEHTLVNVVLVLLSLACLCSCFPSQYSAITSDRQRHLPDLSPSDLYLLAALRKSSHDLRPSDDLRPSHDLRPQSHDVEEDDDVLTPSDVVNRLKTLTFFEVIRHVLYEQGVTSSETDDVIGKLKQIWRLESRQSGHQKRAMKRFAVKARLSPFGSPLVPSTNFEKSESKVPLRYGRSFGGQ